MARKKNEHDKLSRENAQALAAGMSYGKWKAMQPVVPIKPKPPKECYIEHICEHCGCTFVRFDNMQVKYCGDMCRNAAFRKKAKERSNGNGGQE